LAFERLLRRLAPRLDLACFAMQPPSYGNAARWFGYRLPERRRGQGNACSFINSLYTGFGSGIVANGFFLQSRGALFELEEGIPTLSRPTSAPITPSSGNWEPKTANCGRRLA